MEKAWQNSTSGAIPKYKRSNPQTKSPTAWVIEILLAHRATLVSSSAAVCIDTRPIEANTNEIGAMPRFIEELHRTYGRTSIFDTIITDAGNSAASVAQQLNELNYGYILAIKENHGEIHLESHRRLTHQSPTTTVVLSENGKQVTYRLYRELLDVNGYLTWTHARQIVRVERCTNGGDQQTQGNRYFVSNLPYNRLNERQWLRAIRAYWRCENNNHWTADVFWHEDSKRTPWTTNPETVYALSALRMIALNILAVMRSMSREPGFGVGKLPWRNVIKLMQAQLTTVETSPEETLRFV